MISFICGSHTFVPFMTYNRILPRVTRRVPLEVHEPLSLPEHLSSFTVLLWDSYSPILRFSVFCRSSFVLFPFGHCIVCPLIFGFLLPLWYLQTFLSSVCRSQNSALIFSFMTYHRNIYKNNTEHMSSLLVLSKNCVAQSDVSV